MNTQKLKDNIVMKILQNNSGYSVKSFFLFSVTCLCFLLMLMPIIAISTELYFNHSITMSWSDIATYIAAVFTGTTGAGIVKAWSEKYERFPGADGRLGTEDDIIVKRDKYSAE